MNQRYFEIEREAQERAQEIATNVENTVRTCNECENTVRNIRVQALVHTYSQKNGAMSNTSKVPSTQCTVPDEAMLTE
jgi:hypothetical protein